MLQQAKITPIILFICCFLISKSSSSFNPGLSKVVTDFIEDVNVKSCKVLHVFQNPSSNFMLSSLTAPNPQLVLNLGPTTNESSLFLESYLKAFVRFPQCTMTFLYGDQDFAVNYLKMMWDRGWTRSHYKFVAFVEDGNPETFFGSDSFLESFYHLIMVTSGAQVSI